MKKERYANVRPYQLIVDEEFYRLMKSEAAKVGMTVKDFIIEAVKKLIDEKNNNQR